MTQQKNHHSVNTKAYRTFRFSQKALMYDAQRETYLILRATEATDAACPHAAWMKKYGPMDLPGGHVDGRDADLRAALAREMREETGIDITSLTVLPCTTMLMVNEQSPHPECVVSVALVLYDGGAVTLSNEHAELLWLTADDVERHDDVAPWIKDSVRAARDVVAGLAAQDRWRRCVADFDNYKKRQAQTHKEFVEYAAEGVIMDMLPVVDNFHAATDHIPADQADNPWVTGIMYIQQQMEKVFEEKGVTRMDAKNGDMFDPARMEAVKETEDAEIDGDAIVIKVVQPGYLMGTKVLRPARVVVQQRDAADAADSMNAEHEPTSKRKGGDTL